jgi:cobaltochelatase CobS
MARSATMTEQEAELILGPRGNLGILSAERRKVVRKWLVACGLPSERVNMLHSGTMRAAYNDHSGKVLADLFKLPMAVPTGVENIAQQEREEEATAPDITVPAIEPAPAPAPAPVSDVEKAIRLIAESVVPKRAPLDEARVLELIKSAASFETKITSVIEIKTADSVKTLPPALRHYQFELALRVVSAGIPLALIGAAGGGKSTIAMQIAQALDIQCYLQGAIANAFELLGFTDANGKYHRTPCRDACEYGGLLALDDFDASTDSAAPLVMQALLANGHMTFPDSTRPIDKHAAFRCIMSMNTYGTGADRQYVGRTQLDAAMLDRFFFLTLNYDENMERVAAGGSPRNTTPMTFKGEKITADEWIDRVQKIRAAVALEKVRMVVSPRASIMGVKLLAAGLSLEQVEEGLIWKGLDKDTRARVTARAGI